MASKRLYNTDIQTYNGINLKLCTYSARNLRHLKAKKFLVCTPDKVVTSQSVWIPNRYVTEDDTILPKSKLDWVFIKAFRKLEIAGYYYGSN